MKTKNPKPQTKPATLPNGNPDRAPLAYPDAESLFFAGITLDELAARYADDATDALAHVADKLKPVVGNAERLKPLADGALLAVANGESPELYLARLTAAAGLVLKFIAEAQAVLAVIPPECWKTPDSV